MAGKSRERSLPELDSPIRCSISRNRASFYKITILAWFTPFRSVRSVLVHLVGPARRFPGFHIPANHPKQLTGQRQIRMLVSCNPAAPADSILGILALQESVTVPW